MVAVRDRLTALRRGLARLTPWRRRGVLFLAGLLSVLAFAPFHIWPLLWLTLPILFFSIDEPGAKPANRLRVAIWQSWASGASAENAWWFGFGFHVAGLIWIGEAFLVEADVFAWMIPFVITGLPAGLALFFALAGGIAAQVGCLPLLSRVLIFAVALGVSEWLRGHVLTGFPWNVLGYALTMPLTFMQSAGLFGIYGLTLVAAVLFVWPVAAWLADRGDNGISCARETLWAGVFCCATVAGLYGYGAYRLNLDAVLPDEPQTRTLVRVVQPSVPQREKWRPENQRAIFDLHKALSVPREGVSHADGVSHEVIVWPEAAMPFFPLDQPVALDEIGAMLAERSVLVTGALRRGTETSPLGRPVVYNSMLVFGPGVPATVAGIYDKIHLVPFGEYLPFQSTLERIGLEQLSRLRGGFASSGWPRKHLDLAGVGRIIPLICYEAIFPSAINSFRERPRMIVNVTNDGWFGDSLGPRQHFHQSRVRAVEEAVPFVRSANNGISAVFDGLGRVMGRLELNQRGVIDLELPNSAPTTIYSRYGDNIFLGMMVLFLMIAALRCRGIDLHRNIS